MKSLINLIFLSMHSISHLLRPNIYVGTILSFDKHIQLNFILSTNKFDLFNKKLSMALM